MELVTASIGQICYFEDRRRHQRRHVLPPAVETQSNSAIAAELQVQPDAQRLLHRLDALGPARGAGERGRHAVHWTPDAQTSSTWAIATGATSPPSTRSA